jgi:hypothetical protein
LKVFFDLSQRIEARVLDTLKRIAVHPHLAKKRNPLYELPHKPIRHHCPNWSSGCKPEDRIAAAMGLSPANAMMTTSILTTGKSSATAWYRPVISPEHGVYVVLAVSFLIGTAAAQAWTWATTLALVCAFCGFQAEHPLVLQIKQRKTWKPRFLVWGGLYGGLAGLSALGLYGLQGWGWSPLLGIYGAATIALLIDAIAVFRRGQKSIFNELVTFAAVCLAAPLADGATTGMLTPTVWGLWALCSLYFSSTIFTVKLRKPHKGEAPEARLQRAIAHHAIAALAIALLWSVGILPPIPALAFTVVLLKFLGIWWQLPRFCQAPIGLVAALETTTALLFGVIVMVSLLPVHGSTVGLG